MPDEKKFTLWARRRVEVNTDPQRRCYNGCHFSSELVWTKWEDLLDYSTMEAAEDTKTTFEKCNPHGDREYKIMPIGEKP